MVFEVNMYKVPPELLCKVTDLCLKHFSCVYLMFTDNFQLEILEAEILNSVSI